MSYPSWTKKIVRFQLLASAIFIIFLLPLLIWQKFNSFNVDGVDVKFALLVAVSAYIAPLCSALLAHRRMNYQDFRKLSNLLLALSSLFSLFVAIKLVTELTHLLKLNFTISGPAFSLVHSLLFVALFLSIFMLSRGHSAKAPKKQN